MKCNNSVDQTVPSGLDYKIVTMKCGNTSIYGEPLYCDACRAIHTSRGHDSHQCKHGRDLYSDDGRDITCFACEME